MPSSLLLALAFVPHPWPSPVVPHRWPLPLDPWPLALVPGPFTHTSLALVLDPGLLGPSRPYNVVLLPTVLQAKTLGVGGSWPKAT